MTDDTSPIQTDLRTDREELKDMAGFLSRLPESVRNGLRVFGSEGPEDYLYHISRDFALSRLEPRVPRRALKDENASIPRVCTATTVANCIRGYSTDVTDFVNHSSSEKSAGRWALYGIPFRYALLPSARLLPDVKTSSERWLVTYNEDTVSYIPVLLARYFYHTVTFVAQRRNFPSVEVELFIEVLTQTPVQFSHDVLLPQGYWCVQLVGLHESRRWNQGYKVVAKKVTPQFFADKQKLVSGMISLESFTPPSAHW